MEELFKYTRANVRINNKDTEELLFADHNLFVDTGRVFIAQALRGVISGGTINPAAFVCDLGSGGATPTTNDVDLVTPILDACLPVIGTPAAFAGQPTGIIFNFSYTNGGALDVTLRELGLFYRVDSNDFPRRGSPPAPGPMLARLKTTLSSIVISPARSITIEWKILF